MVTHVTWEITSLLPESDREDNPSARAVCVNVWPAIIGENAKANGFDTDILSRYEIEGGRFEKRWTDRLQEGRG